MGQYDAVVVTEGPDDETAAKLLLMIGAQGSIHTETFRAFTEEEYRIPYSISSMKYSSPLPSGKIYQGWKESPIVPVHQYI